MLIYDCSNKVRQELASLDQNNQHQHHLVNVIQLKVCNTVKMINVQMFNYSGVHSTKMSSNVTWHYNTDYVTVQIEWVKSQQVLVKTLQVVMQKHNMRTIGKPRLCENSIWCLDPGVRIRIRPDSELLDPIRIRPEPKCLDPVWIRIRPDPKCLDPDPAGSENCGSGAPLFSKNPLLDD